MPSPDPRAWLRLDFRELARGTEGGRRDNRGQGPQAPGAARDGVTTSTDGLEGERIWNVLHLRCW